MPHQRTFFNHPLRENICSVVVDEDYVAPPYLRTQLYTRDAGMLFGLPPIFMTPGSGAMMHLEVGHGEEGIQPRVQA